MVMNFWEAQRRARSRTLWYVFVFILLTIGVACLAEWSMRFFAPESYDPPFPFIGLGFLAITFTVAIFQYLTFSLQGGAYVAESMGGIQLTPQNANSAKEQQLLNIVEEIALASSIPTPPVYLIQAQEINAFAAGLTPENAVIAVTEGSVNNLTRDELQGVIAHEFGHIYNGDMLIGMRMAAMVMGFYFVLYLAMNIMRFSSIRGRRSDNKGGNPIMIAAIILCAAGALTWLAGSILKCMINRQREYLADASSVQFTRNPNGIIGALRKIENEQTHDMPKKGIAYSHLYFEDTSLVNQLFATHPPIAKRIAALEGQK